MKCYNCGIEHQETTFNCCWIKCSCGERICGKCGSGNISKIEIDKNDESQYWCCLKCNDCNLEGCGYCK